MDFKREKPVSPPEIEPRFPGLPARSQGVTLTSPSGFMMSVEGFNDMLMLAGPRIVYCNTPTVAARATTKARLRLEVKIPFMLFV
jgi:hypothetical protein